MTTTGVVAPVALTRCADCRMSALEACEEPLEPRMVVSPSAWHLLPAASVETLSNHRFARKDLLFLLKRQTDLLHCSLVSTQVDTSAEAPLWEF